jgi:hypothetical protein
MLARLPDYQWFRAFVRRRMAVARPLPAGD